MKTIFYDVDTQNDFMNKDGALYVPDAEELKPSLAALTVFACENGIPVFGSVDRHFGSEQNKHLEAELQRNGGPFPDHCMAGTEGQRKIRETICPSFGFGEFIVRSGFIEHSLRDAGMVFYDFAGVVRIVREEDIKTEIFSFINNYTSTCIPRIPRGNCVVYNTTGIFFEKQRYDVASNPWFEKVMQLVAPGNAVVYGVATDYCVKAAVLGLRALGINVFVVEDAIKGVAPETTKKALEEMKSSGARFITVSDVLENMVMAHA